MELVVVVGAAELLDPPVGPDPVGLFQRAHAVGSLRADVEDAVVLEAHREVASTCLRP